MMVSSSITAAMYLKQEGLTAGVADVFCMIAKGNYHGLWIEFKSKNGKLTPLQEEFLNIAEIEGFKTIVVHSFEEAKQQFLDYLKGK